MNGRAQLTRLLQEMEGSFSSVVSRVAIYGMADNQLGEDGRATIKWELVVDSRDYGLKSVSVLIKQVDIQYTNVNLDTQEEQPQSFNWKLGQPSWTIDVDCAAKSLPFSLYPLDVELYAKERRIIVNF
jgi:hypothetical protein